MSFRYLLDANAYIQAKNFHYRMEIVPGFWDWLDLQMGQNEVGTIDMVFDELTDGTDHLADWAADRKKRVVTVDDERTQEFFADVANHVMSHPVYEEPHTSLFLAGADPWLIASAAATGASVITHEARVPASSKRVKIPNVCEEFAVPYFSTFDLMGKLSARLVLDPEAPGQIEGKSG
ncbi:MULTISPECIES: DUF4411 family protein [unclassified Thioalkalivibrio]|uniref:DUF4411 family protein n=1 Tax=unclassified Thioalkalivibrio TaxID=2621013 RepID=UPI00036FDA24|nr:MULTISPECIES: DUF4411 family protein [unclassified Thioalkalivibrio]